MMQVVPAPWTVRAHEYHETLDPLAPEALTGTRGAVSWSGVSRWGPVVSRYKAYIQSPEWAKKRAKIMARAGGVCESKGCERFARQVHHKTYARLGHERDTDLVALCFPCHQARHPDKAIEGRSRALPTEWDCEHCPSMTADIFFGDTDLLFICHGCGHDARRAWKRGGKSPKKEKDTPCEVCGKLLAGERGVRDHTRVVHPEHVPVRKEPPRKARKRPRKRKRRASSGTPDLTPPPDTDPIPRNNYREWIKGQ